MYVRKRDGRREAVAFDKITSRIKKLCYNLDMNYVDPVKVTQKVIGGVYEDVTTTELDNLAAETAAYLTTQHPDYAILAARITVSNLHKETKKIFSSVIEDLYQYINPKTGKKASMIAKETYDIVMENADRLNSAIIYDRDFGYNFFGFKTLERSYLLRINGKVAERPQHMLMRVSVGIHGRDIDAALETYNYLSEKYFTHASPTLFNAGTPCPQLSSCFLLTMKDDSIEGIYDTLKQCAMISKTAGGIGLNVHKIRAKNSYIAGTNGSSNGIIPMLRVFNNTARYVDQGGNKRPGAFAMYLEPWHADIFEFLDLRKNTGKEENRARDLFYALWIPDLFMKRVESNGDWSLFCPAEAPDLEEFYGDEFEALYEKYEREGRARKVIKAQKLWYAILDSQAETGVPFMLYKDACNKKSNQQNLGTIKCSNLCTEIVEYTSPDEVAVCNLASINLSAFVTEDQTYDFSKFHYVVKLMTRNLNKIIDINYYPVPEARRSNMRHRPIGLGVQGLADTFIKMRMPFDSPEARQLNRDIFEALYFGALEASCELAEKLGTYETYAGSPASKGLLQYDLWNVEPSNRNDWAGLKEKIARFGLRNSLLIAPMPTASTSQILGNNECLVGDTLVTLRSGLSLPINRMPEKGGSKVISYREDHGSLGSEHQAELLIRGERDVVELTMSDGRTIKCTPDHRFMLVDGSYINAQDITMDHELAFSVGGTEDVIGSDEKGYVLNSLLGAWSMEEQRESICQFARILGYVQANSQVSGNKLICHFFSADDAEAFIEDCTSICATSDIQVQFTDRFVVSIQGLLVSAIRQLTSSAIFSVPNFVQSGPLCVVREFLGGLFGGSFETSSIPTVSQTCCARNAHSVYKSMEIVSKLLDRFNLSTSAAERPSAAQVDGKLLSCGCHVHKKISLELCMALDESFRFMECVGVRYSSLKTVQYGIAASYSAYISRVSGQFKEIFESAKCFASLEQSTAQFTLRKPLLSRDGRQPTSELYLTWLDTGKIELGSEFAMSPAEFTEHIGACSFDSVHSGQPIFRLNMLCRKEAGRATVYDINVDVTHNFVANGMVVHNCFEPYTSNIYTRRVLSGEFQIVNPHLLKDLTQMKLWDDDLRNRMIAQNGSIQNIDCIPDDLKKIYRTVWEISQKSIIDMAADRGAFIDQSQSLNIHLAEANYGKLTSMHFYGWKKGLKTGMYYLRTRPAADAIQFTVDQTALKAKSNSKSSDSMNMAAMVCSLENRDECLMCSG